MEPCIQRNLVPLHLKERFERSLLTSTKWAHLIIDAFPHEDLGEEDDNNGTLDSGSGDDLTNEEMEDDGTLKDGAQDTQTRQSAVKLVWDGRLESNPSDWRPTACAHQVAIEFFQQAISKSYLEKKRFGALIEGHMTRVVRGHLGDLKQIVRDH